MKSELEKEIGGVRAVARRGEEGACEAKVQRSTRFRATTAQQGFKVQSFETRVEFTVLHSNMVGNIMFLSSVKPSQSESNQIKPLQIVSSMETGVGMMLTADVAEAYGMGRFDATLLYG